MCLLSVLCESELICFICRKSKHWQRSKNNNYHLKEAPSADHNRLQQTKRALFKSPPFDHQRKCSRSGSKKNKSNIDRNRVQRSRRALWPSTSKDNATLTTGDDRAHSNLSGLINVYGKRVRDECGVLAVRKNCPRRMLHGDAEIEGDSDMIVGDKCQRALCRDPAGYLSEVNGDVTEYKKCPRRMLFGDAAVEGKSVMIADDKSQRAVCRDTAGGLSEVHRKVRFLALS